MKYEKEIDVLLKDLFYHTWMDDDDYNEVVEQTFKTIGTSKQKLSEEIDVGVKNGYPVEKQILLLKQILNIS